MARPWSAIEESKGIESLPQTFKNNKIIDQPF
jgi:hypothetical protein